MKWQFVPQPQYLVEMGVTQRDQFNNDEVDISETIVRETIQNSLDAAVDDPCQVKVSFRWLDKSQGLNPGYLKELLNDQLPHAIESGIEVERLDFGNPRVLVIEDFGTTGLTGLTTKKDDDHFNDFWRRHGKSHKSGKARGRWGLGKLVYSVTSDAGAFFGLTKRDGDAQLYLMGQTVLNLRSMGGKLYPAHSYWSELENKGEPYDELPIPCTNGEIIEEFTRNFKVNRMKSPGLSIVIPFPNKRFNIAKMIEVAIANYFYPLITGQLELNFDDIEINSHNVRQLASDYAQKRFHQIDLLFDFVEEIFEAEQGDLLELKPSWSNDRKLDENDFDSETLEEIREKFVNGELVGLYLPVTLKPKSKADPNQETGFSVYVKRSEELTQGVALYVRSGLTLPAEASFGERRAMGAMIAEHPSICEFLGDAENAAHTKWITQTEKLSKKYRNYQGTITAIKRSVIQLYDLLSQVVEERDKDALQDFFWFEEPEAGTKKKRRKPKPPRPIPPLPKQKPLLNLNKVSGGFTLSSTNDFTEDHLPRDVKIEMAYAVPRGNAFKNISRTISTLVNQETSNTAPTRSLSKLSVPKNKYWSFRLQRYRFDYP